MAETRVGWPLGFKNGPGEDSVANYHGVATTRDPVTNAVTDVVDKYGSVFSSVSGDTFLSVVADGITDDAPSIQAQIDNWSESNRAAFKFPLNKRIKLNSGLILRASVATLDLNGSILDFSGMSNGTAILINPPIDPYGPYSALRDCICNGMIIGPDIDATTVDGIKIDAVSIGIGALTGLSFRNLTIEGFRDNLISDRRAYINHLWNVNLIGAHRYNLNYPCSSYAGENLSMFGGRIADAHNASNTACGIYIPSGSNGQLHLFGVSIDYNDTQGLLYSGCVRAYGGNHENNKTTAAWVLNQSGSDYIELVLACDTTLTEASPGRNSYIETTGDQIFVQLGGFFRAYQMTTELVTVVSGTPKVDWSSLNLLATGGDSLQPQICNFYNSVYQGQDATSPVVTPWTASGASVTPSVGVGAGYLSGNSIRLTWSGAGSANAYYEVNVTPGKILLFEGRINITSAPASTNIFLRIRFVDKAGNLLQNNDIKSWTAITGGYEKFSNWRRVPAGAIGCRIDFWNGATAPVLDLDNIKAWII